MAAMQETFSTIRPGPGGRFCAEKPRSCCLPGGSFTCVSAAANSCLPLREACRLNGLPTVPLKRRKSIMLTRASRAENEAPANGEYRGEPKRTAVVWFKRDLRIDDHPGLATASSYSHVIPLFVYDPVLLSGMSEELINALQDAILDLQLSLQKLGSNLAIRTGRTADVLLDIANEVGALDVITEAEIEMDLDKLVGVVSASLSVETIAGQDMTVKQWRNSLYNIQNYEELPDCYKKFQASKPPVGCPLEPPTSLPPFPRNLEAGCGPPSKELQITWTSAASKTVNWESFKGAQRISAETALGDQSNSRRSLSNGAVAENPSGGMFKELIAWREKYILASPYEAIEKKRRELTGEAEVNDQEGYVVKGGATGALNILQGYLRFQEPTGRDDWQEVHEHVMSLETRPGASFRALFGNSLALGTLSLRRVYHEAIEYERARGGGWLSPFGFSSFTAAAAINDAKAIEWYQLLAHQSREQGRQKGFQVGTWRWRGYLVQYAVVGEMGPPVVFVHGFGAFWEHFRDNMKGVAEAGNRVWGLTMLGFGRSEKPMITYTDLVWGELVRDFIIEVVKEPVILGGNSIGGYTASVVAGLWPSLVQSLVLFNSAGRVVPDYQSLEYRKPKEKSYVAYIGSRLLLAYLQNLSNGMLTKCYPTNPGRADNWLQNEVMRASYDPNSTAVLEAMFHLRAPLPLNYYLDRYDGNVLVIQGMRDPLHNSSLRASMLQAYCKNVSIQYVNAGHCPHDEVPEEVNSILVSWLKSSFSIPQADAAEEREMNKVWLPDSQEAADLDEELEQQRNQLSADPVTRLKEEMEELV
ncbi:hypothetical protein MPTK1_8g09280 [Marchantia polymorpha subsp. ruderalis]|uniref:Photolyase/cryptochrome alpha/beta domain-containing protein n=1 Tax=Marchantia polymorpha TaxID=3197 RepID=A0A2R6W2F0_MARPO|nr:hypothetical protein MARPO_0176s0011 [Marchantia polymorpha]BBN19275.1 hypothetical protein Mp_8g09280 [Marchantia polymorpha subsp. ruderalis]|eukprot:PTQ28027.1 hypothetical protein MARPO_0176s0011 [Marchantia polymorpha]